MGIPSKNQKNGSCYTILHLGWRKFRKRSRFFLNISNAACSSFVPVESAGVTRMETFKCMVSNQLISKHLEIQSDIPLNRQPSWKMLWQNALSLPGGCAWIPYHQIWRSRWSSGGKWRERGPSFRCWSVQGELDFWWIFRAKLCGTFKPSCLLFFGSLLKKKMMKSPKNCPLSLVSGHHFFDLLGPRQKRMQNLTYLVVEDYNGGRSYADLQKFAQGLGPVCSPANLDLCDDEKKKKIDE